MRRYTALALALALVFVFLCLASCSQSVEEGYYTRTQRNEHGRLSVSLSRSSKDSRSLSEAKLKEIFDGACAAFEEAYVFLSPNGGLKSINEPVNTVLDVDKDLIKELSLAYELSESTGGLYQPCGGALTSLFKSSAAPEEDAVAEALLHIGCDKMTLSKASVQKADPAAQIDLYAYADAYALRAAVEYLEKSDVLFGTVTFNGIAGVFGEKPDGEPFLIDISDGSESGRDGSFSVKHGYVALVTKNFGSSYDFFDGNLEPTLKKAAVYSEDPITAAVMASIAYSYGNEALTELYKNDKFSFESVLTDLDGNDIYSKNAEKMELYFPETQPETDEEK